ncbi:hypothetical protein [Oerskovia flava]|uniref:hypothetical protein n=1 Tax=Oerskovia flava TaxID=2986422 RepID=UPI00223FE5B4|nr:hypothetical protein [Oerskovia sp. JB1-3-2]
MTAQFGPAFEAELSYRQEQVRRSFPRDEAVLLHWLRSRRTRRTAARAPRA